jgi:hypothetical protein
MGEMVQLGVLIVLLVLIVLAVDRTEELWTRFLLRRMGRLR